MSASPVRVRFAPSPTGFLHIGGVRTALFNYLFARQKDGKFLMRIEDTDLDRSEQKYTDDILESMKWLGMESDEPLLYQSQRLDLYQSIANKLVEQGLAYRCYCTEEEVEKTREEAMKAGKKPMYARTCRDQKYHAVGAPSGREKFAVRAAFPLSGVTKFHDLIRGDISFPNEDMDDFVLIRSNGVPTYNFVVVVDDIEMKITHVIRGDDHINNTPKQVFVYETLKASLPLFAHLPMILGHDKKKLSKRTGETSTHAYRKNGYLPEAVLNFLVRLGWSHGDQEVFTLPEMIQLFDFKNVQVSGAVFNEEKLMWIAGEHMKRASDSYLQTSLIQYLSQYSEEAFPAGGLSNLAMERLRGEYGLKLIAQLKQKTKLLKELAEQLQTLLEPGVVAVDASTLKWNKDPALKEKIKGAIRALIEEGKGFAEKNAIADHAFVDAWFRRICEQHGIKLGDFTQPMRLFVTGKATSAIGLFDLFPIMPWTEIEKRLEACLNSN